MNEHGEVGVEEKSHRRVFIAEEAVKLAERTAAEHDVLLEDLLEEAIFTAFGDPVLSRTVKKKTASRTYKSLRQTGLPD